MLLAKLAAPQPLPGMRQSQKVCVTCRSGLQAAKLSANSPGSRLKPLLRWGVSFSVAHALPARTFLRQPRHRIGTWNGFAVCGEAAVPSPVMERHKNTCLPGFFALLFTDQAGAREPILKSEFAGVH